MVDGRAVIGTQSAEETPMCQAITQHGTWGIAYVPGFGQRMFQARPGRDFICTQDSGHDGKHKACDGHGHVLAMWPRRDPEQYGHGRLHPEWSLAMAEDTTYDCCKHCKHHINDPPHDRPCPEGCNDDPA